MRAVIQRVSSAEVQIAGKTHSQIDTGLLILLGITHEDQTADLDYIIQKISHMRIFSDPNGVMNLSMQQVEADVLIISQFTLYAGTRKGNRPSYIRSAPPAISQPIYEQFITKMEQLFPGKIRTGIFGADMQVKLVNDGPVTIILDSHQKDF